VLAGIDTCHSLKYIRNYKALIALQTFFSDIPRMMLTTRLPGTTAMTTFWLYASSYLIVLAWTEEACCLGMAITSLLKMSLGKATIVVGSRKMLLLLNDTTTRSIELSFVASADTSNGWSKLS
jgi:hypothetical protein